MNVQMNSAAVRRIGDNDLLKIAENAQQLAEQYRSIKDSRLQAIRAVRDLSYENQQRRLAAEILRELTPRAMARARDGENALYLMRLDDQDFQLGSANADVTTEPPVKSTSAAGILYSKCRKAGFRAEFRQRTTRGATRYWLVIGW